MLLATQMVTVAIALLINWQRKRGDIAREKYACNIPVNGQSSMAE